MADGIDARDGQSVGASYRNAYEDSITDDTAGRVVVLDSSGDSDVTVIDVGRYGFASVTAQSVTQDTDVTVEYKNHPDQPSWRSLSAVTATAGGGLTDVLGSETEAANITGVAQMRIKTSVTSGGDADVFVHLES
jgi:hypothetical protein